MAGLQKIDTEDFNYDLPEHRIARYPAGDRSGSKLLVYRHGNLNHFPFKTLPDILPKESTLVFNNTEVIHARLQFRKPTGALIEIFCLEPFSPPSFEQALMAKGHAVWNCMVGNLKKWKDESLEGSLMLDGKKIRLQAKKTGFDNKEVRIEFNWDPPDKTFGSILENAGLIPIPPYLKRKSEDIDLERYQTVYSEIPGSVAAPTAGLHFTDEVLTGLDKKGIHGVNLTLHVSSGTFQPVKTRDATRHCMHREHFSISREALQKLLKPREELVAVGTTSLRTLESLYWIAGKIRQGKQNPLNLKQWEAYGIHSSLQWKEAVSVLLEFMDKEQMERLEALTAIMIVAGYEFHSISALITNFHLPKSTLLMLIAAWIGEDWRRVYNYALENDFRFLSYGDSSILFNY